MSLKFYSTSSVGSDKPDNFGGYPCDELQSFDFFIDSNRNGLAEGYYFPFILKNESEEECSATVEICTQEFTIFNVPDCSFSVHQRLRFSAPELNWPKAGLLLCSTGEVMRYFLYENDIVVSERGCSCSEAKPSVKGMTWQYRVPLVLGIDVQNTNKPMTVWKDLQKWRLIWKKKHQVVISGDKHTGFWLYMAVNRAEEKFDLPFSIKVE